MSILAGRQVTRLWAKPHSVEVRRRAKALAAVSLSCFLVTCGLEVSSSVDDPPIAGLVSFLETHHLYSGVGDFWAASLTTVWSNGKISVPPLVPASDEVLEGFNRGEAPGWFRRQRFQFVVYPASNGANSNFSVATDRHEALGLTHSHLSCLGLRGALVAALHQGLPLRASDAAFLVTRPTMSCAPDQLRCDGGRVSISRNQSTSGRFDAAHRGSERRRRA
jgi:hypothetical protein